MTLRRAVWAMSIVGLLAGLLACDPPRVRSTAELVTDLRSVDEDAREDAAKGLASVLARDPATAGALPALIAAAKAETNPDALMAMLRALGRSGSPEAVPVLQEFMMRGATIHWRVPVAAVEASQLWSVAARRPFGGPGGQPGALAGPAGALPPDPSSLAVIFPAPRPAIPALFAKVTFGMSESEVAERVPELKDGSYAPTRQLKYECEFERGRLDRIEVRLREDDVLPVLEKNWGPSKRALDRSSRQRFVWFEPEQRVRVVLERTDTTDHVIFERYLPLESIVSEGRLGATFTEILGATQADIEAQHGATAFSRSGDSIQFKLPSSEFAEHGTSVWIDFAKGKPKKVTVLYADDLMDGATEALEAALQKAFGAPKPGQYLSREVAVYRAKDPWIALDNDGPKLKVIIKPGGP